MGYQNRKIRELVGAKVSAVKADRDLTFQQMADELSCGDLEISRQRVHQWASGQVAPSERALRQMLRIYQRGSWQFDLAAALMDYVMPGYSTWILASKS